MAFGKFIKKVFSFGSKKVEEEPAEAEVAQEPAEQLSPPVEPADQKVMPEPFDPEDFITRLEKMDKTEADAAVDALPPEHQELYFEAWEKASAAEFEAIQAEAAENDLAPEEAAQLEADDPWVEPEESIENVIEEQLDDIEQGLAKIDSAEEASEPVLRQAQDEGDEVQTQDDGDVSQAQDEDGELLDPDEVIEEQAETVSNRDETRGSITIGDAEKAEVTPEPEPEKTGWFARLTSGLSRSSKQLTDNITGVFTKRKLDDETLEELEDILIQADLGVETAMRITDSLSSGRYGKDISTDEVRDVMGAEITKVLEPVAMPLELDLAHKPHVILVVGVNGTGKTTTIGKLAAKLRDAGLKVTLGAGDTFRAAAIEQLKIWADRTGSTFVGTKLGADAAGLAYGAYETARDNGSDVVIIDTAGRLQNKTELMDELAKIVRVLQKHDPEAPHTVLQTLDATTGQNALSQVEIFRNVAGVNGLVMTKLDGTARGGILVAIAAKFKLPVYFIGVGEGIDDLEPFRATDFSSAIVGTGLEAEA